MVTLLTLQIAIAQQNYTKHTVLQGETIMDITKKYNITPYDLYKHNPSAKNGLKKNDILSIPLLNIQSSKKNNVEKTEIAQIVNKKNEQSSKQDYVHISKIDLESKINDNTNTSQSEIGLNNESHSLSFIELNKIPIDKLNKQQCFELLDRMVKANNGKLLPNNYTQFKASFTSQGIGLISGDGLYENSKLYLTRGLKWDAIKAVNASKLNFKHSCVCIDFSDGFSAFYNIIDLEYLKCSGQFENGWDGERELSECSRKLKNDILNNPNLSNIDENQIKFVDKGKRGKISIIVNNEDADKFVDIIKRISIISIEEKNNIQQNLISKEKWIQGKLIKWHEDSEGNYQGRYEVINYDGKLVTYGNYRNNMKIGKWVIEGVVRMFTLFNQNCSCNFN